MKKAYNNRRRYIPLFILGALTLAAGLGWLLMTLWNLALVPAVGAASIGFWQALALLVLSRILLGGRWGGRRGMRHRWMREKWDALSDADKERFRQHCGPRYNYMTPDQPVDVQTG